MLLNLFFSLLVCNHVSSEHMILAKYVMVQPSVTRDRNFYVSQTLLLHHFYLFIYYTYF